MLIFPVIIREEQSKKDREARQQAESLNESLRKEVGGLQSSLEELQAQVSTALHGV